MLGAQGDRQGARAELTVPAPVRVDAGVVAVEVDHAAAGERVALRRHRHRQHLLDGPSPGVGCEAEPAHTSRRALEPDAGLPLARRLAGVEGERAGARGAAVERELGGGEALRVVGAGVERVEDRDQLAVAAQAAAQRRLSAGAPRRAVRAVAVGRLLPEVEGVAAAAPARPRAARRERSAPQAVAAGHQARLELAVARRRGAEQLDHAAGGVAVEGGERPAQRLDAGGGVEDEVRDLPLPVGHRRRNAVAVEAHAAHAEGRARAEAADRDLEVLRLVLAVARQDAGDAPQRLGEVQPRLRAPDLGRVEAIDRRRDLQGILRVPSRGDHDGLGGDGVHGRRVLGRGAADHERRDGERTGQGRLSAKSMVTPASEDKVSRPSTIV